jgi:hypothetical protein
VIHWITTLYFRIPGVRLAAGLGLAALLSGCVNGSVPLCYHRTFETGACHIKVSEWGKGGTDPDGEHVEVSMEWQDGHTAKCTFELWDRVVDSWVADLDADGKPEVVIISRSFGTGSYGEARVVTMEGSALIAVVVPKLSGEYARGYEGHDEYHKDGLGRIIRTFPIYAENDPNYRPSGGTRKIIYEFRDKRLVPVE